MTSLPRDADGAPIQVAGLGAAHKITVTAASARNATAFSEGILTLYATIGMFIKPGGASVAATNADHYLPPGIPTDISIGGSKNASLTHLAAIRDGGADGILYISERK